LGLQYSLKGKTDEIDRGGNMKPQSAQTVKGFHLLIVALFPWDLRGGFF
jgi:hypothetical protein